MLCSDSPQGHHDFAEEGQARAASFAGQTLRSSWVSRTRMRRCSTAFLSEPVVVSVVTAGALCTYGDTLLAAEEPDEHLKAMVEEEQARHDGSRGTSRGKRQIYPS